MLCVLSMGYSLEYCTLENSLVRRGKQGCSSARMPLAVQQCAWQCAGTSALLQCAWLLQTLQWDGGVLQHWMGIPCSCSIVCMVICICIHCPTLGVWWWKQSLLQLQRFMLLKLHVLDGSHCLSNMALMLWLDWVT
jgi:hypothetical protein